MYRTCLILLTLIGIALPAQANTEFAMLADTTSFDQGTVPSVREVICCLQPSLPEPDQRGTRVSFLLRQAGRTRLEVLSPQGDSVLLVHEGHLSAGRHEFLLKDRKLGNGTYLLALSHGDQRKVQRMMLLR